MKRTVQAAGAVLLAAVSTLALLLAQVDGSVAAAQGDLSSHVLTALSGQAVGGAILFGMLVALFCFTLLQPFAWRRGDRFRLFLLSMLFAGVAAIGAAYRADDGSLAGFPLRLHLLYLAGKGVGFFALCWVGGKAMLMALPALSRRLAPVSAPDNRALRRTFFFCWGLIMLLWLPSILARLPGVLTADAGRVLQQFTGEILWTSDHPPAYTLLLGGLVSLGAAVGGDAFGLALYTVFQALFLSAAMAYAVTALRRENVPRLALAMLLAYFALGPMSLTHAALVIKDVPYSAAFLVYITLLYRALMRPEQSARSPGWWVGYGCSALTMVLLRPNGMLVAVPTMVVLAVFLLRALQGRCKTLAGLLTVPLIAAVLFNALLVPALAYQPESTADVLGVSFQQTSRILKNSPQDATAADLAALDRVLDANKLGPSYQAKNSDPVRKLYRYFNGHTGADVLGAVRVWARLSASHPLTAFHAAWSLIGGYLDPFDTTAQPITASLLLGSPKYPAAYAFTASDDPAPWQTAFLRLESAYRSLPPIVALAVPGVWAWLALFTALLIGRGGKRWLGWLLLPVWMTLLACLLSAGFTSGIRYALPVMLCAPWALCALLPAILADQRVPPGQPFSIAHESSPLAR